MTTRRGTTNTNARGNAQDRAARRAWLLEAYAANVRAVVTSGGVVVEANDAAIAAGRDEPACRCYRCGCLLVEATLTVDRVVPGCRGGRYTRDNLRPACGPCNSSTGATLRAEPDVVHVEGQLAMIGGDS